MLLFDMKQCHGMVYFRFEIVDNESLDYNKGHMTSESSYISFYSMTETKRL